MRIGESGGASYKINFSIILWEFAVSFFEQFSTSQSLNFVLIDVQSFSLCLTFLKTVKKRFKYRHLVKS